MKMLVEFIKVKFVYLQRRDNDRLFIEYYLS